MNTHSWRALLRRRSIILVAGLALLVAAARPAAAQSSPSPSNTGALHFTGGLDVPSVYVFRGIVQESDPALTLFPYGDLGITLKSGDGAFQSIGVDIGTWHSLQTGSSGSDGPSRKIHYEEDFYGALTFGLGGGMALTTAYTAYTSPNFMFNNVKEISVKVAKTGMFNPYGLVGFELSDNGQADNGAAKGTYLELGVAPSWRLTGRATVTVPVKVGLSLKDYYELAGEDSRFGFLDVGGVLTLPIGSAGSFGSWNVHGGVDLYTFGDTTRAFNGADQNKTRVVVLGGIGVRY
jgi:hypothetical protein